MTHNKEEFFINIAEAENGKFYFKDKDFNYLFDGSNPNIVHKILFEYKDCQFNIFNQNGINFAGSIVCEFSKKLKPVAFEIEKISRFHKWLFKREFRLQIKTKDAFIESFIKSNNHFKVLNELAEKQHFSPLIMCRPKKNWEIITEYPLQYGDWKNVIYPIINFYKDLIDQFE